jgi:hypothetical protein
MGNFSFFLSVHPLFYPPIQKLCYEQSRSWNFELEAPRTNSRGVYKDVKRKGRQGLERGLSLEREIKSFIRKPWENASMKKKEYGAALKTCERRFFYFLETSLKTPELSPVLKYPPKLKKLST